MSSVQEKNAFISEISIGNHYSPADVEAVRHLLLFPVGSIFPSAPRFAVLNKEGSVIRQKGTHPIQPEYPLSNKSTELQKNE
jgi:hypothetical protein